MGQNLSLCEHEIVISTWLWRQYEVTANCYVLQLADEFHSLLADVGSYSETEVKLLIPVLLDAYNNLDAFLRENTPYINTVQTSYGFYSKTIAYLHFLVPHAGIPYVT